MPAPTHPRPIFPTMFYDNSSHHPYQAIHERLDTLLPPQEALLVLREHIHQLDPDAAVNIEPEGLSARWTSPELAEPVLISHLGDEALWLQCAARDLTLCQLVKASFAAAREVSPPCPASRTALEVVETLMCDPSWNRRVHVLPQALKAAEDCPYQQLESLSRHLELLAVYAELRATTRGRSAEQVAIEVGLGAVYRPHISKTACNKYGEEYTALWNGRRELLREHLTLGGTCNDRVCMSVHFLWDNATGRVVIGHIGRHRTNTLTNT